MGDIMAGPAGLVWRHWPCRSAACGQHITMARTEARQSMPIETDRAGHVVPASEDGRQVVWEEGGRLRCRTWAAEDERVGLQPWELRARDHYQMCPGAGEFSRGGRA